jgi:hypothetical protein
MPVKYRGVPFEDGDKFWIVPALPLGLLQDPDIAAHTDKVGQPLAPNESWRDRFRSDNLVIIKAALQRNYPDVTDADIMGFVTLENVGDVVSAAMGTYRSDAQRVKDPGEIKPVIA